MAATTGGAARIAVAGLLALAVAMGIGRFAFTPVLPLMLAVGSVDLAGGSRLATANYLGHLVGAGLCALQPWLWTRLPGLPAWRYTTVVRGGLLVTALATLAVAVPIPATWPALRLLAGASSAVVLVYTSGWCLERLAQQGASALGGVVFTGPGVGIVASGLLGMAMVAGGGSAGLAWTLLSGLALAATWIVWPIFRGGNERLAAAPPASAAGPSHRPAVQSWLLVLAYTMAGFGYIVTATFAPVIARAAGIGQGWVDAFWPLFGVSVVVGALLATRIPPTGDRRTWLAASHLMQALGIAVGLAWPTVSGFVATSVMLGLPFTTITLLAMQEARRLRPHGSAALMGLLTMAYGVGQIVGPPLVSWRLARSSTAMDGFNAALAIAAAGLVTAAVVYVGMVRCWPQRRAGATS